MVLFLFYRVRILPPGRLVRRIVVGPVRRCALPWSKSNLPLPLARTRDCTIRHRFAGIRQTN